jgi:hypothetical protein
MCRQSSGEVIVVENEKKSSTRAEKIIADFRKTGLRVKDVTQDGGGIGFLGGVRKPKTKAPAPETDRADPN